MPLLSLVITCYNEEDNVLPLMQAVRQALTGIDYEVILVDDGSTDQTAARLKQVAGERTVLVELRRNFGQSNAMMAGIDQSTGKYIALLDGDLQNDPADIPGMLRLLENSDADMIAGNRANRQDGYLLRKLPSRIANALIRKLTGVHIRDYGCTLKLFKREIAVALELYGEMHRFIPVLAAMQGARMVQTDVRHHPRIHGKSKYGIGRTFRVLADLLVLIYRKKYQQKPMHFFGITGLFFTGAGLLTALAVTWLKLAGYPVSLSFPLTAALLLLLAGILFIGIGLIADQLMRTYYEAQSRKPYKIRHVTRPGASLSS